jgi:CCR4-NOT transcription complex subunit 4
MPSPSLSLSAADFPALVPSAPKEDQSPTKASASLLPNKSQDRSLRKAAKKAAAAEKSAEKQKGPTDKPGASKAKTLQVRVDTKDAKEASSPTTASEVASPILPVTASKVPSTSKPQSSVNKGKSEAKRPEAIEVQKEAKLPRKEDTTPKERPKDKRLDNASNTTNSKQAPRPAKAQPPPATPLPEPRPVAQVPILSKKPKKSKPQAKQPKVVKEDDLGVDSHRNIQPTEASGASTTATTPKVRSPSKSPDRRNRLSTEELLEEISRVHPGMDLVNHPFFDLQRLSSTTKMPLEYGPLVHALSALSVGGGSFANNVPSGSIDTAVSSFQQLLETLTQTISDLLRLLPRTTWDDSSSFDGVLRDMLKGDDFLDENGEDGQGQEDEVAALTLALERRARWMEVQLSKLEELHRDINTAAVKAVLTFNDDGWDKHGFLPQLGNSLKRFEGLKSEGGELTSDELEKKLADAKKVAMEAEAEAKEGMTKLQSVKEFDSDLY